MDIGMPVMKDWWPLGIEASMSEDKMHSSDAHDEDQYVVEALRAGIQGYILKNQAAPI